MPLDVSHYFFIFFSFSSEEIIFIKENLLWCESFFISVDAILSIGIGLKIMIILNEWRIGPFDTYLI